MSAASQNELVAAEIRAELARQKMSIRSLADASGYTFDVIRPRVAGKTPFNPDQLHAIGLALGITAVELLVRANTQTGEAA